MSKVHQITWLMLAMNGLAVYRASILVTRDKITEPIRTWIDAHFTGRLVDFIFCPWCVSMWLGAGACVLTWLYWPVWMWVCLGGSCSAIAGFLGEHS